MLKVLRVLTTIFQIALAVLLIIAIFNMPTWYYELLRSIISPTFLGLAIYTLYKESEAGFAIFLFSLAFLFNPILQFYFNKFWWIIFDIFAMIGVFFFGALKDNFNEVK